MKIAVSGKGGVGKTTFAAFLIKALTNEGKKVLAIDADRDGRPPFEKDVETLRDVSEMLMKLKD